MKETKQTQIVRPKLERVESPNFFAFKEIGDTIEGILTLKEHSDQYGFGIYTIQKEDMSRVKCHGSSNLDDLMSVLNINDYVLITFVKEQKLPKGTLKLFEVEKGSI
jgi:hypothetical protein